MPRKPVVRETVSLYEAKTQLSRLVDRAAAGEEIVIAKSGRPRARLVPLEDTRAHRVPGRGKGRWRLRKDFDAPLPDDVLRDFEGGR
ncbi:MAG: type II toxin-antitoxin system prevent-host-death family antitoxin [Gemmatimonadota bacterium]|nr:type II toxin-antitoxin system prevent-host-death family antitoxin [Gemmatimonadota bacterium]